MIIAAEEKGTPPLLWYVVQRSIGDNSQIARLRSMDVSITIALFQLTEGYKSSK
jgi:hypothetical protein